MTARLQHRHKGATVCELQHSSKANVSLPTNKNTEPAAGISQGQQIGTHVSHFNIAFLGNTNLHGLNIIIIELIIEFLNGRVIVHLVCNLKCPVDSFTDVFFLNGGLWGKCFFCCSVSGQWDKLAIRLNGSAYPAALIHPYINGL